MKKSLRIASILLVLVLVTSCFVGGTFAKYVTTGDPATDSARVAEWGVKITATTEMFSDSYKHAATDYDANEEGDAITVQAKTEGVNVVAPGTQGALVGFALEGKPEVDVEVSYAAELTLTNWTVDTAYYCPIAITVASDNAQSPTVLNGMDFDSVTEFQDAVNAAIRGCTATYDANTNLATAVANDLQVSWAWAFTGGVDQTDDLDTKLGNNAADGNPANIALSVTATVTQID